MEFIDKKRLKMLIILGVLMVLTYSSLLIANRMLEAQNEEIRQAPAVTEPAVSEEWAGR